MASLNVGADAGSAAMQAAERITTLIETAVGARGAAAVCLTGGTTAALLYELLGNPAQPWRTRIDWPAVHLFWSDERHVPADHPDSNVGMARRTLIDHVPVRASQVHRMRGELQDPHDAAREYELLLPDVFDVMLLGLGADAHIASLFPGSPLLAAVGGAPRRALVAAVWAEHLEAWRITLTPPAILNARAIVLFAAGTAKADAVYAALEAAPDVSRYPAQLLRHADDRTEWFLDKAAAGRLSVTLDLPY